LYHGQDVFSVLGKRTNPPILIENYEEKKVPKGVGGMSNLIPPSQRPTLDPSSLSEKIYSNEKIPHSLSTMMASPQTP